MKEKNDSQKKFVSYLNSYLIPNRISSGGPFEFSIPGSNEYTLLPLTSYPSTWDMSDSEERWVNSPRRH